MNTTAAILTGDLVGSSPAGQEAVDLTMKALSQAAADITGWNTGAPTRLTRYRGDGWQMLIKQPEYALRAALFVRARLRADDRLLDTRIAIGEGPINSIGTEDLSDGHGAAFTASGHALDSMKRMARITLAGPAISGFQRIIVDLLAERSTRWTREQAEAMAQYLHPDNPTLNDIAPLLNISPQAVNYRLKGAAAVEIRQALREWENTYMDVTTDQAKPQVTKQ
jgi:hypothetical protein